MFSRLLVISLCVSLACAALFCFVPLLHLLGYESAALAGVLVPLLCIPLWFAATAESSPDAERSPEDSRPWRTWWAHMKVGCLVAAPFPVLLLLNALRVRNCNLWEGGLFFVLIVPVSIAVASLWAVCVRTLAPAKPWRQRVLFVGLVALSALGPLLFAAFEPPIVAHHPLIGYFAGSIYDEALSIPTPLIVYRAWNLGFVLLALIGLDVAWRRRHGHWENVGWLALLAAVLACACIAVYAQRAPLGLEIDRDHIETKLAHRHETEHFVLHVSPSSWHSKHIEAIALDHEVRYAQLRAMFGSEPFQDPNRKIHSYIYPNSTTKGALMGGRRTMVAKLWLGEMHIIYPNLGFPVLTHELAHVFSRPYGSGPLMLSARFKVIPNMGLVEGLAEAAEWDRDELSPHMWSAAMRAMDLAPDIRSLVRADGFYQSASSKSYTLMGSFSRFLIDTYGMETFLKAYAEGDFQSAYNKDPDTLVSEWERFIDTLKPSEDTRALASFYFDRKSIFSKVCARTLAALRVDAQNFANQGQRERALECLREILIHKPKDPATHLRLARLLVRFQRHTEALEHVQEALQLDTLSSAHRASFHLLQGDIFWAQNDLERARKAWETCLMPGLPWATRRAVQARLHAGANPHARDYFIHPSRNTLSLYSATSWAHEEPSNPLALYILGRNLWQRRAWAHALLALRRAVEVEGGAGLVPPLRAEAYRLMAESALALGEWGSAREAYTHIVDAEELPDGLRARARDGLDRVRWAKKLQPNQRD